MTGEKLRLFTAVSLPEAQIAWLDAATAGLKTLEGARWTAPESRHVTLNFLGWVPAGALTDVVAATDAVAGRHVPARATLSALGAFPRVSRARVLWAGIDDPSERLAALAEDLGNELRPTGYEPEERAYKAHLTLARFKVPRPLDGLLPELPEPPGDFPIDRVTLFRSTLRPSGSRYEVLHEAYLGETGRGAGRGSQ